MLEPRFDATVSQCSSRRSDQRENPSVPYHTHVGSRDSGGSGGTGACVKKKSISVEDLFGAKKKRHRDVPTGDPIFFGHYHSLFCFFFCFRGGCRKAYFVKLSPGSIEVLRKI